MLLDVLHLQHFVLRALPNGIPVEVVCVRRGITWQHSTAQHSTTLGSPPYVVRYTRTASGRRTVHEDVFHLGIGFVALWSRGLSAPASWWWQWGGGWLGVAGTRHLHYHTRGGLRAQRIFRRHLHRQAHPHVLMPGPAAVFRLNSTTGRLACCVVPWQLCGDLHLDGAPAKGAHGPHACSGTAILSE